jgi:flagellar basal body-associated protein FliL
MGVGVSPLKDTKVIILVVLVVVLIIALVIAIPKMKGGSPESAIEGSAPSAGTEPVAPQPLPGESTEGGTGETGGG